MTTSGKEEEERKKLEEERERTERINARVRKKIRSREKSYKEGSGGLNQQTYHDLQNQDKGKLRESEGMIAGLDWAIEIKEQAGRATGQSSITTGINGSHPMPPTRVPRRRSRTPLAATTQTPQTP